jgi:hypothetical protein
VKRTRLTDHKSGLYRTPVEAVRSLIHCEGKRLPRHIWEPACGDGAIALPLREQGYRVEATDLVDRGCPAAESAIDFLMEREAYGFARGIVTNPPYRLAQAFAEKALSLVPYVALLLPLSFLAGQERGCWLRTSPLKRVWVSSRRLPMMHRDGWAGPVSTSQVDHAWFVWERSWENMGGPGVGWFDYEAL